MRYEVVLFSERGTETESVPFREMEDVRKQFDITVDRALLAVICLRRFPQNPTSAEYYGRMNLPSLERELGLIWWRNKLFLEDGEEPISKVRCGWSEVNDGDRERRKRFFNRLALSGDTQGQEEGE